MKPRKWILARDPVLGRQYVFPEGYVFSEDEPPSEIIDVIEFKAYKYLEEERDALVVAHDTQCKIAIEFQKLFKEIEPEMTRLDNENKKLKEDLNRYKGTEETL
jgi:hypothetical protein